MGKKQYACTTYRPEAKYHDKKRKSPPYSATDCVGHILRGNDGNDWLATIKGKSARWVKVEISESPVRKFRARKRSKSRARKSRRKSRARNRSKSPTRKSKRKTSVRKSKRKSRRKSKRKSPARKSRRKSRAVKSRRKSRALKSRRRGGNKKKASKKK